MMSLKVNEISTSIWKFVWIWMKSRIIIEWIYWIYLIYLIFQLFFVTLHLLCWYYIMMFHYDAFLRSSWVLYNCIMMFHYDIFLKSSWVLHYCIMMLHYDALLKCCYTMLSFLFHDKFLFQYSINHFLSK